jgi:hypothetical protein
MSNREEGTMNAKRIEKEQAGNEQAQRSMPARGASMPGQGRRTG